MNERAESLLVQILAQLQEQTQVMRDLVNALAEGDDSSGDEPGPTTYMDGTPCH